MKVQFKVTLRQWEFLGNLTSLGSMPNGGRTDIEDEKVLEFIGVIKKKQVGNDFVYILTEKGWKYATSCDTVDLDYEEVDLPEINRGGQAY